MWEKKTKQLEKIPFTEWIRNITPAGYKPSTLKSIMSPFKYAALSRLWSWICTNVCTNNAFCGYWLLCAVSTGSNIICNKNRQFNQTSSNTKSTTKHWSDTKRMLKNCLNRRPQWEPEQRKGLYWWTTLGMMRSENILLFNSVNKDWYQIVKWTFFTIVSCRRHCK